MIQLAFPFKKRQKEDVGVDRFKEVESVDLIMKKAGFNVVSNGNVGSGKFVSVKRKYTPRSKVKPLSTEETIKLIDSQRGRRQLSYSSSKIQRKTKVVQKQRNSPEKKKKKKLMLSNADAFRAKTHKQTQHRLIAKVLSPREKVLEVLRLFQLVFSELDRDKAARRGEPKIARRSIDFKTRAILMNKGKQVNNQKMIGPVPGIEVGDEFQYKSELNLIGLHFDIMGGIDYMHRGHTKLATSIVSSEDNGYNDRFESGVIIYTGEGGYMMSKDHKVVKDQKLVMGNEALANSMKEKTPVRVIRGEKRLDQRGRKLYVYDGLYWVKDYWKEKGAQGNILFKFRLCRIPGQPHVYLKH